MFANIADPKVFTQALLTLAGDSPPPLVPNDKPATKWFEMLMQKLASTHGLYCKNRSADLPGEWMALDHVLVSNNAYDSFPLIVVEHENRNISSATERGQLPAGNDNMAFVEWATWKALAVNAKLRVVVAYPWKKDKTAVLGVLTKMLQAYYDFYQRDPSALFLLGWWEQTDNVRTTWAVEDLSCAYVSCVSDGRVDLQPLAALNAD